MQILMIAGNVGNVKEVREVGGDKVLNFSLAVDNGKDKNGERRESTWYDCALWGKRAESLAPYITKGLKLALSGRPGARAHDGKAYLSLTVNELTFMGGGKDRQDERTGGGGNDDDYSAGFARPGPKMSYDLNDDIPFITSFGLI